MSETQRAVVYGFLVWGFYRGIGSTLMVYDKVHTHNDPGSCCELLK